MADHLRQQQQLELPPGFRYLPTDEEIITLYLIPKVLDRAFVTEAIGEVDLTKYDPWELPGQAKMGEREWYFYCHKKHKDSTWTHTHCATKAGYWKSTGKDRQISSQPPPVLIGMRKTLVFYIGRAPQGKKTAWVMHEYRIETRREQVSYAAAAIIYAASKDEWVVCRIFHKRSGVENVVMPSNAMTEMPMSMGDQQQSFVVDSVTTKRAPMANHLYQHHCQQQLELPPGFRYHPTDEEIITFYLIPKVLDRTFVTEAIGEVDLRKYEPWELPGQAKMGEREWYFYCHKDCKYPTGTRTNQATETGYWKATGRDKQISVSPPQVFVGMRKTIVFYKGRAPRGEKTSWVMHEYRIETRKEHVPYATSSAVTAIINAASKDKWVVCRIFDKSSGVENVVMPSYAMAAMPMSMGDQQQSFVVNSGTACTLPSLMDYSTSSSSLVPPQPLLHAAGTDTIDDAWFDDMWHAWFDDVWHGPANDETDTTLGTTATTSSRCR